MRRGRTCASVVGSVIHTVLITALGISMPTEALAEAVDERRPYCAERDNTNIEIDSKRPYCMQTTCEAASGGTISCEQAQKQGVALTYRQPLWWPWLKRTIVIRPDYTCRQSCAPEMNRKRLQLTLEKAIDAWNRATLENQQTPCSDLKIVLGPPPADRSSNLYKGSADKPVYDNTVMFRDEGSESAWVRNDAVDNRDSPSILALTVVRFNPDSGEIYDADIDFNGFFGHVWSDAPAADGEFNLLLVAAHEFGHLLGFAHNSNPCSLMYPRVEVGCADPKRPTPEAPLFPSIDVVGICEAYPIGEPTPWAPQDFVYGGLRGTSPVGSCQLAARPRRVDMELGMWACMGVGCFWRRKRRNRSRTA